MAPRNAGCKRPHDLTLAVYDPAAADQRRPKKTLPANLSADTGALVLPYVAVAPPIEAEPINAVPMDAVAPGRAEPARIRKLLPRLKLRFDLPVHFIDEKVVTQTDLDAHQNRFRLPSGGVQRHLRPILSPEELDAANLLDEEAPRPRTPKQQPTDGAVATDGEQGRRRRKGKKHGGLPVLVVDMNGGIKQLQLSRWDSSRGAIIKGEGYLDFISRCSFKEKDVVEIWAFKQPMFRNFGVTMCAESPLYMVMVKRDGEQRQPTMPPLPDLSQ